MAIVTDSAPDTRRTLLEAWLRRDLGLAGCRIEPASADASFRRYFRVHAGARTLIAMDAPPEREDLGPFVAVAAALDRIGVAVPRVLEQDRQRGFLLLTDLGSTHYLAAFGAGGDVDALYRDATAALVRIQARGGGGGERAGGLRRADAGPGIPAVP